MKSLSEFIAYVILNSLEFKSVSQKGQNIPLFDPCN